MMMMMVNFFLENYDAVQTRKEGRKEGSKGKTTERRGFRENSAPVVSEDEEGPEHCALRQPIQGPNEPSVEVSSSGRQSKHNCDISGHETHGLPYILFPAMLGNGSSNVSQSKWRNRRWIKLPLLIIIIFCCSRFFRWQSKRPKRYRHHSHDTTILTSSPTTSTSPLPSPPPPQLQTQSKAWNNRRRRRK